MDFKAFIIDPKDAQRILIGADGKLSPMEFAQGLVAIIAVSIVFQLVGLLLSGILGLLWLPVTFVVAIGILFAWVCIYSKRFHDAGKSGWMTLAAIGAGIVLYVIGGLILSPIFPSPGITALGDMAAIQAARSSLAFREILLTLIVHGALGYYMFRLKPAAAAADA